MVMTTNSTDVLGRTLQVEYGGHDTDTPAKYSCRDGKKYDGSGLILPPAGQIDKTKGSLIHALVRGFVGQVLTTISETKYTEIDPLGRVTKSSQSTGGLSDAQFEYHYSDYGTLAGVKYPSGNWVTYEVTGANRVKKVRKGQAGDSYYLQGATYTPAGARKSAVVGINGASGLWGEAWSYNNHLQAKSLSVQDPGTTLLHLRWAYTEGANQTTLEDSGWQNNGNLHFEQVQYPTPSGTSTILRTYVYDLTNRVTSFSEGYGGASQSFNYDGFGNIWQTASSGVPQLRQNSSSWYIQSGDGANRLSNTEYDAAGNQTQLSVTGGAEATTAFYDAENKVASIMSGAGEVARYTYDAEGRRVAKTVGPVTTYFVYGADGQLMAEYGGPSETTKTHYYVTDYLGSTRMILNETGGCEQRIDYAPFGGEIPRSGVACYEQDLSNKPMFTGQMRDEESHAGTETGLDYFGARYLSGAMGRFTSPDALFADQHTEDPQSWNLYSYVRNNPLAMVDRTGRDALWVVSKTSGQATLRIPVKFGGSGATASNINAIVNRVQSLNIVGSPVKIEVVVTDKKINGVLNKMDFSPGLDTKKYGPAGEGVNKLGGNEAHIDSTPATGTDAAAHDILHFAGIEDQYVEGPRTASGERTSSPTAGYSNSNIMTSRSGTDLDATQIQQANTNKTTKHCVEDSNGTTKCK